MGLRRFSFSVSTLFGSLGGLLVGCGRSGKSSRSLRWSDLERRVLCLWSILKAAFDSVSNARRGSKAGRGGSGGAGALFDGTRCGLFWWGWERVERLRRGVSYGSRGRGIYESVGPLTFEWKLDFWECFDRSSSFIGPCGLCGL